MLRLYDSRHDRPVAFRLSRRRVTLYVCGITPYDTTHLGHARTFLLFDLLIRHLEAAGQRYVQNVTDIDESILKRAARDGESWRGLGKRQERSFLADMRALGWRAPEVMPHATREIRAMCALTRRLIRTGHAYPVPGGGIYYDVSTFPRYGQLSRLPPRECGRSSLPRTTPGSTTPASATLWISPSGATSRPARPFRARSAAADRAGTSSAQRWHNAISACRWTFMVEGPLSSFRITRRSSRRARRHGVDHSSGAGCTWPLCGSMETRCRSRKAT